MDGTFAVVASIAGHALTPYWWVLLLQGLLGIGVGVLTLFNPAITAVALLIYIAVWAIGMGVLQVIAAVRLRHDITGEWWLALGGIAGVAFGILLIRNPAAGALAVLWLIGSYRARLGRDADARWIRCPPAAQAGVGVRLRGARAWPRSLRRRRGAPRDSSSLVASRRSHGLGL